MSVWLTLLQLEWQVSDALPCLMPTFGFFFSQQDGITIFFFFFQNTVLPRVAVFGV